MKAAQAMEMVCPFTIGPGDGGSAMPSQTCRVGQCMAWRWFSHAEVELALQVNLDRSGGYCGRIGKEGAL